ncbi:ribosome small subunit-dependent GTPase A [Bacillaceae bacterium]
MPEGRIIKALSGYYYVYDGEKAIRCRARGVFKKKGITPLVGDWVTYERVGDEGFVTEVHPRTCQLVRPPIANVSQAILVFSLKEPDFNPLLLDKFLVHTEQAGIDAVICLSKRDLVSPAEEGKVREILRIYEGIGYRVIQTSAKRAQGLAELAEALKGKISVFAGQSGVGKSSLLNALVPGLKLETGEISHKLGRGRHTTRHVELLALPQGGWVADTPGFSQLDFFEVEPENLSQYFREMRDKRVSCKFRGCLHVKEPDCAVRSAVEEGEIALSRYEHYVMLLAELKEKKPKY